MIKDSLNKREGSKEIKEKVPEKTKGKNVTAELLFLLFFSHCGGRANVEVSGASGKGLEKF